MADRKISDLTALTTPASGDYVPIVDISEGAAASKNKRVTIQSLFQGIPVNVGIGTSSPTATLQVCPGNPSSSTARAIFNTNDVAGRAGVSISNWTGSATTNGPRIEFDNSTRGVFGIGGADGAHAFVIVDQQTATERVRIDSSGNVGIGTSSPDSTLQVIAGAVAGFRVGYNNTSVNYYDADTQIFRAIDGSERIRIDSSGRVGIGTSSPGTALEVNGAAKASYSITSGGLSAFASSSGGLYTYFSSGASVIQSAADNSGTAAPLLFVSGSERLRIDSSGRVGIGTSAPSYLLHVNTSAATDVELAVQNSAGLARYGTRTSGNAFAGSFTAGKSFELWSANAQAATIDPSGRLLVGTSTAGAGTVDAASIVGSTLNQSTGLRTLSSGGTLDLDLLGAGIVGHLYVASAQTSNAAARTSTIFFITTRLGNATTITSLSSADGSSGGRSFTITNPSANIFRFTDTSSSACTVSMSFVGGIGF